MVAKEIKSAVNADLFFITNIQMKYLKEYLVYEYDWKAQNTVQYAGTPSRRLFDPRNGAQILFIINCFCDSLGITSLSIGKKLEELIYTQLPPEMKSELAVFNWLKGIYLYHSA
jgi:hypothetical protein